MATAGTAHGDGHVFLARLDGLRIPLAEHTQPPAEIPVAIGPWRAIVGAHREVDLLAGALQLIGNLHPRRTRPHYQHRALGELPGIAILSREIGRAHV